MTQQKSKTGLVLSGGGARCIAHLGILQGLEEIGVHTDMISGVSAGALIAVLYASGQSPKQILETVKEHSYANMALTMLSPNSLFSASGIRQVLEAAQVSDFSRLRIPVLVTATDIINGTSITFSSGRLTDIIVGSAAVPGIFNPVHFDGYVLVDGGILDNLPVECLVNQCKTIIGAHVNKLYPQKKKNWDRLSVAERCFHLAIAPGVTRHAERCDFLLEPDLKNYNMFDTKNADKLFKAGYRCVINNKLNLQKIVRHPD